MRAVNLLPPDLRSGPKGSAPAVSTGVENSGAGAFVVLGVLAFAVVALAAYVLAGNTVKDRKAELAAATAKSAAVTQQVTALKPYADFESVANARVQTVKDLANSRFDWEQALRDLSRAVPADVTIASLKGDLGGATSGGHPRRDHRPGDHDHGLHLHADQGRRADGPPAQHRRRHPRVALEVRQGGHGRRHGHRSQRPHRDRLLRQDKRPRLRAGRVLRGRRRPCPPPRPPVRRPPTPATPTSTTPGATAAPAAGTPASAATPGATPAPAGAAGGHPGARHLPARLDHPLTTVTKNKTLLIAVVAAAAATAAFWFLALAPKREEAAKLEAQIATKQTEIETAQQTLAGYKVSKTNYGKNYASVVRLGKAVPEDDDVRSLLVQLDAEAGGTHVDFRTVTIGGTGAANAADQDAAGATGPTPPPGAVSVGSAGFSAMPFTFSFRGSFENLSSFFARMERFVTLRNEQLNVTGRLLRLETHGSAGRRRRLPQHPRADRRQLVPGARDAGPDRGRHRAGPGGRHARGDPGPGRRLRRRRRPPRP